MLEWNGLDRQNEVGVGTCRIFTLYTAVMLYKFPKLLLSYSGYAVLAVQASRTGVIPAMERTGKKSFTFRASRGLYEPRTLRTTHCFLTTHHTINTFSTDHSPARKSSVRSLNFQDRLLQQAPSPPYESHAHSAVKSIPYRLSEYPTSTAPS